MSNIITVSREFGSGGRELGKRLADELGVAYFDKEILEAIAEQTNTSEWYAQEVLERGMLPGYTLHFGHSFSYYSPVAQQAVNLMVAERKVIKELAEKQDCVIVGRGANKILEKEEPFNIFIYADMESKTARCRERAPEDEHLTDRELTKKIRQVDAARAKTQEMISDFKWGDKRWYHLCVNTSGLPIPETAPLVAEYAKHWFERKERYK